MREVIIGGNGFRQCPIVISFGPQPLLSVAEDSGQVHLWVPGRDGRVGLEVDGKSISGDAYRSLTTVLGTDAEPRVFLQHQLILVVSQLSSTTTHVHLDLRPVGLHVFSDAEGLHVGPHTTFFNLAFQAESPAIAVATELQLEAR